MTETQNITLTTPGASDEERKVWSILEKVMDPEVPVLSVIDLGIIRGVSFHEGVPEILITPTYTGCPAMEMISASVKMELMAAGYRSVVVKQVLSPAWTTDWLTDAGKIKLQQYGIAPPNPRQQVCRDDLFVADEAVQCPHCKSWHTHRISEFGSTACKSLFQCDDCREPFDYFKCH